MVDNVHHNIYADTEVEFNQEADNAVQLQIDLFDDVIIDYYLDRVFHALENPSEHPPPLAGPLNYGDCSLSLPCSLPWSVWPPTIGTPASLYFCRVLILQYKAP
uniref:Uncharacterized protein n=1 Tax=Amphilophus citrinellus TaxID=61819 RepID=A0A3Q0RCR6_AMPCI